jgi:hypothetical protein
MEAGVLEDDPHVQRGLIALSLLACPWMFTGCGILKQIEPGAAYSQGVGYSHYATYVHDTKKTACGTCHGDAGSVSPKHAGGSTTASYQVSKLYISVLATQASNGHCGTACSDSNGVAALVNTWKAVEGL